MYRNRGPPILAIVLVYVDVAIKVSLRRETADKTGAFNSGSITGETQMVDGIGCNA